MVDITIISKSEEDYAVSASAEDESDLKDYMTFFDTDIDVTADMKEENHIYKFVVSKDVFKSAHARYSRREFRKSQDRFRRATEFPPLPW